MGYTDRRIHILVESQGVIEAVDSFQISSKLIWDCCHSLVKLVDHKRIQLVWVLGHVLIDGNKKAD